MNKIVKKIIYDLFLKIYIFSRIRVSQTALGSQEGLSNITDFSVFMGFDDNNKNVDLCQPHPLYWCSVNIYMGLY